MRRQLRRTPAAAVSILDLLVDCSDIMDASSGDSYKPPEFEEDTRPPPVKPKLPDTTELLRLPWPVNQMSTELNDADDAKLWPTNVEKLYIQLMVEEMVKGNMQEGIFKRRTWEKILLELNKQTKRNFKIVQVKTKFNRLRQRYRIFTQLLQHTGLRWDAETNTVSATDEVWKNVFTAMPKAKEFRRRGCENYILLETLFNKTTTAGVMTFASTQVPINTDKDCELDERFISTGVHLNVNVEAEAEGDPHIEENIHPNKEVHKETPAKRAKSGSSSKAKKIGRKGERISEMTEAINNFAHIAERNKESRDDRYAAKYGAMTTSSSDSSAMKPTAPTEDYSLEKAINLLNTYEGLPKEKLMKILQALYQHDNRVAFLLLSEEKRKMWMECIGEQ